ncbi:hypothetical protein [Arthrobacter sp. B1805]|uniref:hypothetical protein n=1 Tax=Arthrobacter sp. B1805 TaxID=2058892 RepID=UPI000CE5049B|nr:hypothetical protein [Arthrobacter sp. B1805]
MILDVNTLDLRKALQSVLPHAADDVPAIAGVSITATVDNLYLTATNRYTIGHAIASVWDARRLTGNPADDTFFISIETAKEILALFKSSGKKSDDEVGVGEAMRITVDDENLRFLDVAGLFPGKLLQIPREESEPFPVKWASVFLNSLRANKVLPERLATSGKYLRLFSSAAAAYGEPLVIEPTEGSSILISCGESFLGLLMPVRASDETEVYRQIEAWRMGWAHRLPELAAAMPPMMREDVKA